MSLIIQHGLPRGDAQLPHPDVHGWKPVFGKNDRLRREALAWIEAMMRPRPVYPVDYEPPVVGTAEEDTLFGDGERSPR
jgi:hypothetical protein